MRHRHNGRYLSKTKRGRYAWKRRPVHKLVVSKPKRKRFRDRKLDEQERHMDSIYLLQKEIRPIEEKEYNVELALEHLDAQIDDLEKNKLNFDKGQAMEVYNILQDTSKRLAQKRLAKKIAIEEEETFLKESFPRRIRIKKKGKLITTRQPWEVKALAKKVENRLRPFSKKITVAGSIRRKKNPKDVDIVVIPNNKEKIKETIKKMGKIKAAGNEQILSEINSVPVDIFFANKDNYPSQLLCRTGPSGGNIGMRIAAKKKGYLLNQHGIFIREKNNQPGKLIRTTSEKDIYKTIGLTYKPPELRGL